ncbi:hypothetical protein MTO96_034959 [Rhipicephalus appendiculatus]
MPQSENDDSISITQWKRQLDLDRPCGAVSSDETCWLCHECTAWNTVIQALDMELAVTKSGTLRLQSVPYEKVDRPPLIIAQETARFASLLLSHHTCIQELSLTCSIRARSPFERPPFPIHISPTLSTLIHRRLRLLCITERANAHLDLRDIHTITGLETLLIRCEGHNQRIAAEVDALLERNRTTLKNFDIWEFGQRREGLAMLEGLVACESLTFKANHNNGGMPYMDAMVSLMRVSTSLHEVVAQPIRDRELTLIAKALETNCTLSKLSLHIVQDCSIEQLFKALQLNKNLKELFSVRKRTYERGLLEGGGVGFGKQRLSANAQHGASDSRRRRRNDALVGRLVEKSYFGVSLHKLRAR